MIARGPQRCLRTLVPGPVKTLAFCVQSTQLQRHMETRRLKLSLLEWDQENLRVVSFDERLACSRALDHKAREL
jgi:hypothetical protein